MKHVRQRIECNPAPKHFRLLSEQRPAMAASGVGSKGEATPEELALREQFMAGELTFPEYLHALLVVNNYIPGKAA